MLTLSTQDLRQLAIDADASICAALGGALSWWKTGAPTDEPDAVASVVSAGIPAIAPKWGAVLNPLGIGVQTIGVFCHLRPRVKFWDQLHIKEECCELADLLIVIDEMHLGGTSDRRALLVQAKKAKHPSKTLTDAQDKVQLDLYQRHPDFYFNHNPYPTNTRNVRSGPGAPRDGFSYGLIDLLPSPVGWEQMQPTNPLVMGSGSSLGTVMAAMVEGSAGRATRPRGLDDWSDTIDLLLSKTFHLPAGGKWAGSPRGVKRLTNFAGYMGGAGLGFVSGSEPGDDDEHFGINTIYVALQSGAG